MPTILFADSFDHYALADIDKKYIAVDFSGLGVNATLGRNGTSALRLGNSNARVTVPLNNLPTCYVEAAFKFISNQVGSFIAFADTNSYQCEVGITVAGELRVTRNGTQLAITSGLALAQNVYYHIGFMATIHPTAGAFEVRLNGTSIPALTLTNQNTRTTANSYANMIWVRFNGNGSMDIDDLVVCSDGFCGDCRVKAIWPQADGNYKQWSLPATSYLYTGGTGDRQASITVTRSGSGWSGSGASQGVVDGIYGGGGIVGTGASNAGNTLQFDFGVARIVTEANVQTAGNTAMGTWQWQGSTDASSWVNIGAQFVWQPSNNYTLMTTLNGNTTSYRYYRILGVTGALNVQGVYEFEFQIDNTVSPIITAHYGMVDEAAMNNDADYVFTNTAGQRNCYDFAAVGVTGNVKAVQHVATLKKDDAGSRTAQLFVRGGSADYDGSNISVTDSYVMQRRVMLINPATGSAWNTIEIDAAQFGTKLVS